MDTKLKTFALALLTCGAAIAPAVAQPVSPAYQLDRYSQVDEFLGISGNGKVAVGYVSTWFNTRPIAFEGSTFRILPTLTGRPNGQGTAVNPDGSVIVGFVSSSDGRQLNAVRWSNGQIEDLGHLNSTFASSRAFALNSDGSVVVGSSSVAEYEDRAVVWRDGSGISELTLANGYNQSSALGVSGDGTLIVGYAHARFNDRRAVLWSNGAFEEITATGGFTPDSANAISRDGNVIVGSMDPGSPYPPVAFRWDSVSRNAVDISGGLLSSANAVNADGSVIVGFVSGLDNRYSNRAFRWTEADGMVSVEQWLRANGATIASDFTFNAYGVSDDGTIVVGATANSQGFIARVIPPTPGPGPGPKPGIIIFEEFAKTLAAKPGARVGLDQIGTILNGARGQPLANRLAPAEQSLWITGDLGSATRSFAAGTIGIVDLGYGKGLDNGVTVRLGGGLIGSRSALDFGGDFTQLGGFIAPEVIVPITDQLHATFSGAYAATNLKVNRGYQNGSAVDISAGSTSLQAWAAQVRLDWLNAFEVGDVGFTPYISASHGQSHIAAYTESGGSFPVSFDAQRDQATVARIGLDAIYRLSDDLRVTGTLEAAVRLEGAGPNTTGQIVGLSAFDLPSAAGERAWVGAGVGIEKDLSLGTATFHVNVSSQGGDPSAWARAGWKMSF